MHLSALTTAFDRLRRLSRRIWVRTTLIALLAVVSAAASPLLELYVPDEVSSRISAGAVNRILEILAASMLTVTTFSLSIMVAARQSASTEGTPRSQRVVLEDPTTQTVIATFLGAFVFALVSLILVSTDVYTGKAVMVILAFTVVVVALVVLAILRWIDHLTDLGGVIATARRLEAEAQDALDDRRRHPCLGANPLSPSRLEIPIEAEVVTSRDTGYVVFLDTGALNACASDATGQVFVVADPGSFVAEGDVLCHFTGRPDPDALRAAFSIGPERTYDHDPRYGVIVLSEIAQRALSPGVNDPGTAIDVVGRLTRLLIPFEDESRVREEVAHRHVWMQPVTPRDLLIDALHPIARDGAGTIEVQIVLQRALEKLARLGDPAMAAAAAEESKAARVLALEALTLDRDKERLTALAEAVTKAAGSR